MAKRCRSVESEFDEHTPRKCVRLVPGAPVATNKCARRRSSATHDALETMLEEEEEESRWGGAGFYASMSAYQREVCELQVRETRRQGVAILSMLSKRFHVDTSTEVFALSVSLLQRCLTTHKLTAEQRESLELPLVCFQIAVKYADGCSPLLSHLCSCIPDVPVHPGTVSALELVVLSFLNWKIETVTAAQILRSALALAPASLREQWRSSLHFHVDLYHGSLPSDSQHHLPSAAASAILGIVAHKAGYSAEHLAAWLPQALMPPLHRMADCDAAACVTPSLPHDPFAICDAAASQSDATPSGPGRAQGAACCGGRGGHDDGARSRRRERETLWCVSALRGALALSAPDVIRRELSASPPLWIPTGGGGCVRVAGA